VTEIMTEPVVGLDPLGDAEAQAEAGVKKNFAKVGSARPSTLLYTYGPGAIVDLPQFTVMPAGLDDWERIWARRDGIPRVHAPRLLDLARVMLGWQVTELRPFPWQPKSNARSDEGRDLGVPARVFPQWLRCTGCDLLGPLTKFEYRNTHPYRTDEACFEHVNCPGRRRAGRSDRSPRRSSSAARRLALPARYLLVCTDGHADEFPYDLWVHRGRACAKDEVPTLKMTDVTTGRGTATVECAGCGLTRSMSEALGATGRTKLPRCRGRHPHLDAFEADGCGNESWLMLVGASNLWFAATQSVIVMPHISPAELKQDLADQMKAAVNVDLADYRGQPKFLRPLLAGKVDVTGLDDAELMEVLELGLAPKPTESERRDRQQKWDPIELLLPEWAYLQRDVLGPEHDDPSGLMLSPRPLDSELPSEITRVLAVDRLRKVNALFGFTRVDAMDRVNDLPDRMAPLTRTNQPTWTVATEDRGEGISCSWTRLRWRLGRSASRIQTSGQLTCRRIGATTTTATRRRPRRSIRTYGCGRRGTGWYTLWPTC
jgi:hypothetical protein